MSEQDFKLNNHLIQNFYIIGLDSSEIFDEKIYEDPTNLDIEQKVLSKFPYFSKSYNNIQNDLVLKHCFPIGFKIIKYPIVPNNSNFFFTLDNVPLNYMDNKKYQKIHFNCYLFYEKLINYLQLKRNKFKLLKIEFSETNLIKEIENYYIPKVICFATLFPFPHEFAKILKILYKNYTQDINYYKNPIEKVIEHLIMDIPLPSYGLYGFNFLLFKERYNFYKNPLNMLQNNSVELNVLFYLFKVEEIVKIFKGILLELPIIFFTPDKKKLTNSVESFLSIISPFEYCYPNISILPCNCYSIIENYDNYVLGVNEEYKEDFFKENNLEIDDKNIIIIDLEKSIIIQTSNNNENEEIQRIILDVPNYEKNMKIQKKLFDNVELPLKYKKKLVASLSAYINKLKNSKTTEKEERDSFNLTIRNEFYYFFASILMNYSDYLKFDNNYLKKYDENFIYKKQDFINIKDIFYYSDYIDEFNKDDRLFFERFLKTKMFLHFIQKKIYPSNTKEKSEVLLFDEQIIEKKNKYFFNKKNKCNFKDNKELLPNKIIIDLTKSSNNNNQFKQSEKEFLIQNENILKAFDYFQIINYDNSTNEIKIEYPIFPCLLYDNIFFKKNYSEIYSNNIVNKYMNIYDSVEEKIIKILENQKSTEIYKENNYSFDTFKNNQYSYKNLMNYNLINLCWLIIFGGSFWYCDKIEREIRFIKMIEIIENLEYIEEDVLEFVYMCLIKYGTDSQCVKFYEILLKVSGLDSYTNFSLLCMKLTKKFNARFMKNISNQSLRVTLLMRESAMTDEVNNIKNDDNDNENNLLFGDENIFRQRSILNYKKNINNKKINNISSEENNNSSQIEEIQFEIQHKCEFCAHSDALDFNNLIKSSISNNNELYFSCSKCHKKSSDEKYKINVLILQNENSKLESFELIDVLNLYNQTRKNFLNLNEFNIDIENLRKKEKNLFYNYIFYFSIRKLPYDFIIPYSNDDTDNYEDFRDSSSEDSSEKVFENLEVCNINENNFEIKSINNNISALRSSFTNRDNLYKNLEISYTSPNLKSMEYKNNKISLMDDNNYNDNDNNNLNKINNKNDEN